MQVKIVSRSEWGFDGWRNTPRAARASSWDYVTFHYDGATPCLKQTGNAMMRNIHGFHKNGRKWSGVGYNFVIDANGTIYEGRGLGFHGAHKPSGPGSNTNGIGVQFHCGGDEELTPAMKNAAAWLIAYCEAKAGKKLKHSWHNNGYSTSCPGAKVTAWVKAGCKPAGAVSAPSEGSTPSKASASAKTKPLAVNGLKDVATVKAWQRWLDTQGSFNFAAHGGFDGDAGPYTISAWQSVLAQKYKFTGVGKADGLFGEKTARASEKFLGIPFTAIPGWYPGLLRGLQVFLNKQIEKGVI